MLGLVPNRRLKGRLRIGGPIAAALLQVAPAMDLLPRSHTEFSSAEYWDRFFKRGEKAFECPPQVHEAQEPVLVVGCGNSRLSEDLYDVGYRGLTNVDISEVVVRQMAERNAEKRAEMKFLQMDVMKCECLINIFHAAAG
ncbi:Methyltransferase-like protein 13 [Branchiostoma belcheri]|nr:Methyltransferase-like protein 13 [Branchiostoma belcheri]